MRKLFSRQLIEARHEMLSIYEAVDLALHDAVKAYVTDDRKLATKTKKRTLSIDARCANLEAVCYNLIATQSPVASDFRLLQTIIYVDFNLQRMTDKVRQICRATRHMVKADISLPQELVGTVEAEAEAVYQVLGSSLSALVTNDMSIICNLAGEDEPVHAAYEKFFRTFNRMDTGDFMDDDSNYDDLRRAIMVSRYLDRIASISIDAACRLTFLLTGQRMTAGDIARTDEDELESMRVPSGEGVIMRPAVDAHYVAKVPANEVSEGLRYLLEHLEDEDDTEDEPTRQKDTQQFRYFGSLLLRQGGEIGFHGYNHQPLVLPNTDYKGLYAYRQWPSEEAITAAMEELIEFQQTVLPYTNGTVYVPPSNILSAEGRRVLGTKVPQIRTIASTYFKDGTDLPYVQEFGVATDGIVEQPRIVSGGMVGDTYMRLAAMSELNMHYVSTHFMHPDDLLDEDRGAAEGWEVYKGGLEDYLKWLSTSAPDLRRQTGTECSGAIQRYAQLTVALDSTDTAWTLHLGNFIDEAWLFFRANEGTPGRVTNGELTHLTGDLYLLKATAGTVHIERKGA